MRTLIRRLLPDGSGKIRIHWFCRGPGPIKTKGRVVMFGINPQHLGGAQGKVACQASRTSLLPEVTGQGINHLEITDDPRAATCPECCATEEYKAAMANYATMYRGGAAAG